MDWCRFTCGCAVTILVLAAHAAEPYEAYYRYLGNYPNQVEADWTEECQGIAHDDTHWYITQRGRLWRVPVTQDLNSFGLFTPGVTFVNLSSVPVLTVAGYNHLGDISVFRNPDTGLQYVLVPIEGGPDGLALFRADASLAFVKHVTWDVIDQRDHSPWIAVDRNGILYSSDFFDITEIDRYQLDWSTVEGPGPIGLQLLSPLPLRNAQGTGPQTVTRVQGGVISASDERLYLVADAIWVFDMADGRRVNVSQNGSGRFNFQFTDGFPEYEEPEGITIWDVDDLGAPGIKGQMHVVLLDNDAPSDDDVYLKHYSGVLYVATTGGTPENGTYARPYRTVTTAVNAAWTGAHLRIRGGIYDETLTISTPMTLDAHNGIARIGE